MTLKMDNALLVEKCGQICYYGQGKCFMCTCIKSKPFNTSIPVGNTQKWNTSITPPNNTKANNTTPSILFVFSMLKL